MVVSTGSRVTDEEVARAAPELIVLAWAATGEGESFGGTAEFGLAGCAGGAEWARSGDSGRAFEYAGAAFGGGSAGIGAGDSKVAPAQ